MDKLTKRATTLVTGVLPALSSAAQNPAAASGSPEGNSQQTLHVSSSSPEVQQQVSCVCLCVYVASE